MILVCGDGRGTNCEGDNKDYDNKKPLSHFEKNAYKQGYDDVAYFGADPYRENKDYAQALYNFMVGEGGSDARFSIVGHSRGAAVTVWASSLFVENNASGKINDIVLLDTDLTKDATRKDTQNDINKLNDGGITISSFNSWRYKYYDLTGEVNLPVGSKTSLRSIEHFTLAVDELYWITYCFP